MVLRTLWRPLLLVAAGIMLSGCLLVRTTEQRITLNANGSGEAYMLLTDIRSDGTTDSIRTRDFGIMMASADSEGVKEFEQEGRKILSKHFLVSGDTLSMELTYSFPRFESLEGLKRTEEGIFVVVKEGREITKTNGKVQSWENDARRIVWPVNAKRLVFQITETSLPASTSLAALYHKYYSGPQGRTP